MKAFGTVRQDFRLTPRPLGPNSLSGYRAAVTGGTNGIGRALALGLADRGAQVIVVGRTRRDGGQAGLSFLRADLSDLKTARGIARELAAETLDLLVMTHGIFAGKRRQTNAAGIELDMAVSYLSRYAIVRELATRIGRGRAAGKPKPRIFNMGFPGKLRVSDLVDFNSEQDYRWSKAHGQTVVGNEALVLDGASRYPGVNFYGLNPGLVQSNIMAGVFGERSFALKLQRTIIGLLFQKPREYAAKILPLLICPDIEGRSGAMFGRHGDPIEPNPWLLRADSIRRVMEESEKLAAKVAP